MRPVFLSYQAPVAKGRIQAYIDGKMDPNDICVFMQDVIEAGLVPSMSAQVDPDFNEYAQHYIEIGLCHLPPRATH